MLEVVLRDGHPVVFRPQVEHDCLVAVPDGDATFLATVFDLLDHDGAVLSLVFIGADAVDVLEVGVRVAALPKVPERRLHNHQLLQSPNEGCSIKWRKQIRSW